MRRRKGNAKKSCPQQEPPLTEDSWLLLCSSSPVCFPSSGIDLAASPYFLSPLYFLSSFCTHSYVHSHTRGSEMRTSRGIGEGGRRWKEASLWRYDWVIERVKGQSSKAVSLSTLLTQTRTNTGTQTGPRLRSTRTGVLFQMRSLLIILRVFMRWRRRGPCVRVVLVDKQGFLHGEQVGWMGGMNHLNRPWFV